MYLLSKARGTILELDWQLCCGSQISLSFAQKNLAHPWAHPFGVFLRHLLLFSTNGARTRPRQTPDQSIMVRDERQMNCVTMSQPSTTQFQLKTTLENKPFENIVGKVENAANQNVNYPSFIDFQVLIHYDFFAGKGFQFGLVLNVFVCIAW